LDANDPSPYEMARRIRTALRFLQLEAAQADLPALAERIIRAIDAAEEEMRRLEPYRSPR